MLKFKLEGRRIKAKTQGENTDDFFFVAKLHATAQKGVYPTNQK